MSSANTVRHMLVAAAFTLLCGAITHAQSPWSALAQAVTAKTKAEATQKAAREQQQLAQAQADSAQKPQDGKGGLVNDPSLGVSHGYQGIKPDTELAAAHVRGAISAIAEKLPTIGARDTAPSLGSELEETTSSLAVNLFQDPEIRKLLGDNPRFVYDPAGKSDPMVVPWVRRAAIIKELMARADKELEAGKADRAVSIYKRILDMRDQRFFAAVQLKLSELAKLEQVDAANLVKAQALQSASEKVDLPVWVHENTVGVLLDKKGGRGALCLVGEYMLHIGEAIPNYPEITVGAIGEKSVTYRYRNHEFNVELNNQ